ncbi:MAG TPA: DUF4388 domain-containing protein [Polyangia bacterium]|nr:DUF4388 domain-containing protein [Polyangia bacterium]
MAFQGDVKTIALREVLGWLADKRATGILSLSRGLVVRQFHLRGGRVTLSASTDQEMLLGRLLVERGIIARERLQEALASRRGKHLRLGTILTRTGVVSKEALRDVLREKSRRLLQDVLGWSEGAFFFDAAAVPKRPTVAASVSLAEILKEPAGGALAPAVRDDVVVGDDDIVEVTDLSNPRRTAGSAEFDAAFTAAEAAWLTRTN